MHLRPLPLQHGCLAWGCPTRYETKNVCSSAQDQCRWQAAKRAYTSQASHYLADPRARSQTTRIWYLCALTIQPAGSLRAAAPLPVLTMMSTYGPCMGHSVRLPGSPRHDKTSMGIACAQTWTLPRSGGSNRHGRAAPCSCTSTGEDGPRLEKPLLGLSLLLCILCGPPRMFGNSQAGHDRQLQSRGETTAQAHPHARSKQCPASGDQLTINLSPGHIAAAPATK